MMDASDVCWRLMEASLNSLRIATGLNSGETGEGSQLSTSPVACTFLHRHFLYYSKACKKMTLATTLKPKVEM